MAFPRGRSLSSVGVALAVGVTLALGMRVAHAGKNDLQLLNLCPTANSASLGAGVQECQWVADRRGANGAIGSQVAPDGEASSNFRSLMSELGVVIAPRLQTPADTLGFAGFQVSA